VARLELKEFQSWAEVEIWELGYFIAPEFYERVEPPSVSGFTIRSFKSFQSFIMSFNRLKPEEVFFILNTLEPTRNPLSWMVFLFLHRRALSIVHNVNSPFPPLLNDIMALQGRTRKEVVRSRVRDYLTRWLYRFIEWLILRRSTSVYVLTKANPEQDSQAKRYLGFSTPIIGESWEVSNLMLEYSGPSKPRYHLPPRFAVLVDGAGPKFNDDRILRLRGEGKYTLTCEDWYPKCRHFFDLLERKLGVVVIIAAHPKANWQPLDTEFGDRIIVQGETHSLIRDSEFVLMRASTAIIAAKFFQKPVFLIGSEELRADEQASHNQRCFQKIYGGLVIDLDATYLDFEVKRMELYLDGFSKNPAGPAAMLGTPNSRLLFDLFGSIET
jgi:hypothetical protein